MRKYTIIRKYTKVYDYMIILYESIQKHQDEVLLRSSRAKHWSNGALYPEKKGKILDCRSTDACKLQ